ncbi:MAG TPA: alpha/beta hydrolase [Acinetobacter sp.]|jgi:polyhydroxyalkanoate synthase|uniref:Poly-beta-hydroxybutyrate polymerase n=1 Tax=Acinetobacter venetianus TaxID=52133 RepID=A0A150HNP1_9GAMM|nr:MULTISPECIES: alpha/beta fold hydrolase [Acinetobacter]MEC8566847.1 alpha/beta fold hydrolase [Pseudomonadota bacterium]KXZ68167.1 Poly-beta-hydroxybutyrate polymerase [Acinetobacter venetianus]MBC68541.1 alpha/beta hydrolase [Acinetobacter sp.]MBT50715.1 alpha/beta hydrolase [Acinetobacter sp.]HBO72404.1 alpha/beta hydrolase [Acinetobacter sp.]
MTQLPKVKQALLNSLTAKKILNSRAGQQTRHILSNATDRVLRGHQLALSGQTPYDVIYQREIISLRHYKTENENSSSKYRVPLVIIPPLAANTLVFDLFPDRSLIRFFLAQGFDVYMIDWGTPSLRQAKYNFGTYIKIFMPDFLQQIREHSGQQQLSLYGWSLGGAISLCYTSLFKDKNIKNLMILASPINTHKSGYIGKLYQRLNTPAQWVRTNTNFRIRQVPSRFFHIHGWQNTLGFKLTDPIGNFKNYWVLLKNLNDRQFVINHATSSSFVDNMLAYPGGVMRDIILRFWIDNELSTGVVKFGEQTAYFKDIDCSVLAIGGDTDIIVTTEAVRPLMSLISSEDKEFKIVPGGHMGLVSGSQAPQTVWPVVSEWLAKRSD